MYARERARFYVRTYIDDISRSMRWKGKFVIDYHKWILHLRFGGDTCKEPAAKIDLDLEFPFALYSTDHEGKTSPRRSQPNCSLEKWQNTANTCVLTATLSFWTRGCLFYVIFRIRFRQHLIYHSFSVSVSLNNQTMKPTVNVPRNINIPRVQNHKVAVRTHASAVLND